ncbi:MAG: hypothetical protein ACP5XB_09360 [Isosphaeraceae bacterium]
MDEEPGQVTTHRKRKSLLRRLITLVVMVLTGGGAGVGGWAFKDHPQVRALIGAIVGEGEEAAADGGLKNELESAVEDVLDRENPRQPGVFRVKIAEIELDPKLFKEGKTVDIQTQVHKLDAQGNETLVWESKSYGQNLAVVGKDDLTATFVNRPFEIAWGPGDRIVVDVWDRKGGLFERKELRMSPPEPGTFPLASGVHPLELKGDSAATLDSPLNHIVFQTVRLGDAAKQRGDEPRTNDPRQLAERPIVIK